MTQQVLLNQPAKFFGAYVVNVSASVGWNADSGNCTVTLVEDPDNGVLFNPPKTGTACKFQLEAFVFSGIFTKWSYRQGIDGKLYDVEIQSPGQILDSVYVILSDWIGSEYVNDDNVDYPASNKLFKIPNVINLYGYKEHILHGGKFGGANVNSTGYLAKNLISEIPIVIKDKKFADKIVYGYSSYDIDLSAFSSIVTEDYRVSAGFPSLSSVVNAIANISLCDYIVYLSGDADSNNVIQNPTIKYKVISRKTPPNKNLLKDLITKDLQSENNEIISCSVGKEISDQPTQKALLGGPISRCWFADRANIYPVWGSRGINENEELFFGRKPAEIEYQDMFSPILVTAEGGDGGDGPNASYDGNWNTYLSDVLEIRCANSSRQTWEAYHMLKALKLGQSSIVVGGVEISLKDYQTLLSESSQVNPQDFLNSSTLAGRYWADLLYGYDSGKVARGWQQAQIETRYRAMKKVADTWGKTYLVHVPLDPGGIENNFRWIEQDRRAEYSWNLVPNAWVGEQFQNQYPNKYLYSEDGRLQNCSVYPILGWANYSVLGNDYDILNGQLVASTRVSIDTNWGVRFVGPSAFDQAPTDYFDSLGLQVGSASDLKYPMAKVIVNTPIFYRDYYTTQYNGINSLCQLILGFQLPDPALYSVGFENITFPLCGIPLVPGIITIGQQSSRMVYGPWYAKSGDDGDKGRLSLEQDPNMIPEVFGNWADFTKAADDLVKAELADLYESEGGWIEKAELPKWNIADKIEGSGPYVTSIAISASVDRITTTYNFSTWARGNQRLAQAKWLISQKQKNYKNEYMMEKKLRELFRPKPFENLDAIMSIIERSNRQEEADVNYADRFQPSANGMFGNLIDRLAYGLNTSVPSIGSGPWDSMFRGIMANFDNGFGQGFEQINTPAKIKNPRIN